MKQFLVANRICSMTDALERHEMSGEPILNEDGSAISAADQLAFEKMAFPPNE